MKNPVCKNCKHCIIKERVNNAKIISVYCDKKEVYLIPPKYSGNHFKAIIKDFKKGNTLLMNCFKKKSKKISI